MTIAPPPYPPKRGVVVSRAQGESAAVRHHGAQSD